MFNDKAFSVTGYDSIINAYNHAKILNREFSSLDLLVGISHQNCKSSSILSSNGFDRYNLDRMYTGILQNHNKENLAINDFIKNAEKLAAIWGENSINADHLFLMLLSHPYFYSSIALSSLNYDLIDFESRLVDQMGKPGFLFSYRNKNDFWSIHFNSWTKLHPKLKLKTWESRSRKDALFSISTDNCGLIVRESNEEFSMSLTIEDKVKYLNVKCSLSSVAMAKTAFIGFALGRLE